MTAHLTPIMEGPPSWPRRQLREVLSERREYGRPELPLLSVSSHEGVRLRAGERDEGLRATGDLDTYLVVHTGDLVVNKLVARSGAFSISTHDGIVSPAYYCFSPDAGRVDPRYLDYALHSGPGIAEIWRRSKDLPPNAFDISRENFGRIRIPLPPLDTQRRIVGMLDAETDRIDKLIAKNERILSLVQLRLAAIRETLLAAYPEAPLRYYVQSLTQGSSPEVGNVTAREEEPGILRLSALRPGKYRPEESKSVEDSDAHHLIGAVLAQEGLVLVSRANTPERVGDACLVDRTLPGPRYVPDLMFALTTAASLAPEYLVHALLTSRVRGQVQSAARGSSPSMVKLRQGDVMSLRIPLPPRSEQEVLVGELKRVDEKTDGLREKVNRQQELLRLRRHALITAAVTGQIEV